MWYPFTIITGIFLAPLVLRYVKRVVAQLEAEQVEIESDFDYYNEMED